MRLPRVVWELTGKDVLTMEFIPGLMRVRPLPRQSRLADAALDAVLEPRLDLRSGLSAFAGQPPSTRVKPTQEALSLLGLSGR